jgi:hypothetical protein
MATVALATEDELSEAVGRRLLEGAQHHLRVGLVFRKGGSGYLRSSVGKWCALAKLQPLLLLTDLDRWSCASALLQDWLGEYHHPEDLVLRIAVREVEAWLLADHEAMQRLLGKKGQLPVNPDALQDPKQRLRQLAKQAKRDVRRDLVAEKGTIAAQGIAYNARLRELVSKDWDPQRASIRSASLRRARRRIDELSARLYVR